MSDYKPPIMLDKLHFYSNEEVFSNPIDLFAISEYLKGDLSYHNQFIFESINGPDVDVKKSFLGLGILFCVEVSRGVLKITGEPAMQKAISAHLPKVNIGGFDATSVLKLIRAIEDIADVTRPDGTVTTLPMLTIIGYDVFSPKSSLPSIFEVPDIAIIVPTVLLTSNHQENTFSLSILREVAPDFIPRRINEAMTRYSRNDKWLSVPLAAPKQIPVKLTVSEKQYVRIVEAAHKHILAGDIYQVQLGHEVIVETKDDASSLYGRLRKINPSPYMFFVNLSSVSLIGASPELFIRIENRKIIMRPLAGTLSKSVNAAKLSLARDPKEQAEHVMLVDLCRNDIGRIATIGSVAVPQLIAIEEYPSVYHLVSTISGEIATNLDTWHVVEACFPAGTVTGTPKIRAMDIIAEYERTKRGLYAGAVLFSEGCGDLVSALIIRTIILQEGVVSVRASAGITADSNSQKEWLETLAKIQSSLKAVTDMKLD